MIKWITLVLLIGFQFNVSAHKFFVSISQINYNQETKSLELALKLFTDDLENCINESTNKSIKISQEHTYDQDIANYLTKHLSIKINEKSSPFNYLGKELEYDVTWCYLEIKSVETISAIEIENSIFTQLLPDQKNLIQLTVGEFEESTILRKNNTTVTYQIP